MANSLLKHRILKTLKNQFDLEEQKLNPNIKYKLDKHNFGLTPQEISKRTKIELQKTKDICLELKEMELIMPITIFGYIQYMLIDKGRVHVSDKIYLNQVWWRNKDYWKWTIGIIVSIILAIIAL